MQVNPESIPFAPAVDYGIGDAPWFVSCANSDGDPDLKPSVTNCWGDNVFVLKNNGEGTFLSTAIFRQKRPGFSLHKEMILIVNDCAVLKS